MKNRDRVNIRTASGIQPATVISTETNVSENLVKLIEVRYDCNPTETRLVNPNHIVDDLDLAIERFTNLVTGVLDDGLESINSINSDLETIKALTE